MKKFVNIIVLVLCAHGLSVAQQLYSYSFTSTSGIFTEISGGTLLGTTVDDGPFYVDPAFLNGGYGSTGPGFDIGFSFTFDGIVYDRFGVSKNGWISLGQSSLSTPVDMNNSIPGSPLISDAVISPSQLVSRIAALGFAQEVKTGTTLMIQNSGVSPNRVCTIQWKNYKYN